MALAVCEGCTTAYAVGLSRCPHCGSTESHEEGTVAKISRHGGPTNKHDPEPEPVMPPQALAEEESPDDGPAVEPEAAPVEDEAATAPARPAANAPKGDWLAYAQALHPDEDLTGYTKADLIELYG
jgi:hypothetical protein